MNKTKLTFYFLLFLILLFSVNAIDECTSPVSADDVPCLLLYPYNDTSNCNQVNISHYSNTNFLFNMTLTNFNDVYCNSTFNLSSVGSYQHRWTTGDTGSIIVTEGSRMYFLLYFALIVMIAMFVVGFWAQDVGFLGVGGMMLMSTGVYIYVDGFNGLNNWYIQSMCVIFSLIGFYIMIRAILEYTDMNKIMG